MIPALFGNILGGSLFCGVYYWWMYLATEDHVDVDGGEFQGRAAGLGLGILGGRGKTTASDEESKIESS